MGREHGAAPSAERRPAIMHAYTAARTARSVPLPRPCGSLPLREVARSMPLLFNVVLASVCVQLMAHSGISTGRRDGDSFLPPTLDDLWAGNASFKLLRSTPVDSPGFQHVDAGTRVVVANGMWFLFGRWDQGASQRCPQRISINVRASTDQGRSWGQPHTVAEPDETTVCIFADGSAFFDSETTTWHYVVQMLDAAGTGGGWMGAHFSLSGSRTPFGNWVPDDKNPVITSGMLWNEICAGPSKHCRVGMVDEGTFHIVEKLGPYFYVTFHGYDYKRRLAARGVARTTNFHHWETDAGDLPGDAIFAAADCQGWNVSWTGGCIGSGEASILRTPSGYMYEVIEAADLQLGCDVVAGEQWWPLGIVRSKTWQASPGWEQMPKTRTPFVGGVAGKQPHTGCSIQYNSLHLDPASGITYFAYWDVSFHPVNQSTPQQSWNEYILQWGQGTLPIEWNGPIQVPPPPPVLPPDCVTKASCKKTCPGYVECPSDGHYYCCKDAELSGCTGQHKCRGTPGLLYCACPSNNTA